MFFPLKEFRKIDVFNFRNVENYKNILDYGSFIQVSIPPNKEILRVIDNYFEQEDISCLLVTDLKYTNWIIIIEDAIGNITVVDKNRIIFKSVGVEDDRKYYLFEREISQKSLNWKPLPLEDCDELWITDFKVLINYIKGNNIIWIS